MAPNEMADLLRQVNTISEAVEDQPLHAYQGADTAARSTWTAGPESRPADARQVAAGG